MRPDELLPLLLPEERLTEELETLDRLPLLLLCDDLGELPDDRGKLPEEPELRSEELALRPEEPDSLRLEEPSEDSALLEADDPLLEDKPLVELPDFPLWPDEEARSELLPTLLFALREDSLEPEPLEPLALADKLEALEPALVAELRADSLPALRDEAFMDEPGEPLAPDELPADAVLPDEAGMDEALGAEAADEPA